MSGRAGHRWWLVVVACSPFSCIFGCGSLVGIEEVSPEGGQSGGSGGVTASEVPLAGPPCRACGDACVDTLTDHDHCGRCGTRCGDGESCLAGVCGRRLHGSTTATSACLRGEDDVLRCWGENRHGQLGRGTISDVEPTPAAPLVPARFGASDGLAVCAVDAAGAVRCAGSNQWGNLGNGKYGGQIECAGSPTCETTATSALLPGPADDVVVGGGEGTIGYSCARLADRSLSCWGRGIDRAVPTARVRNVAQVVSGNAFVCALSFDGRGVFFGAFLGVAGGPTLQESVPVPSVIEVPPAELMVASARGICVSNGPNAHCFGSNAYGQIGLGATDGPDLRPISKVAMPPDPDTGQPEDIIQLAAGAKHVCALVRTGRVLCWGDAEAVGAGELPPGACLGGPCHPAPVAVLEDVREIAGGLDFTLAIKRDGTLWGWGRANASSCVLVTEGGCATSGFGVPTRLFGPLAPDDRGRRAGLAGPSAFASAHKLGRSQTSLHVSSAHRYSATASGSLEHVLGGFGSVQGEQLGFFAQASYSIEHVFEMQRTQGSSAQLACGQLAGHSRHRQSRTAFKGSTWKQVIAGNGAALAQPRQVGSVAQTPASAGQTEPMQAVHCAPSPPAPT